MTSIARLSAISLALGLAATLLTGCGGTASSRTIKQYAYVGTGSNVAQYQVLPSGQLSPLNPPTAPSTSAYSVATSPNGRYAYATNRADATVSIYTISTNGTLTAASPATIATGGHPSAVVVHPFRVHVYVANSTDGTISQYIIGQGGDLSPLSPATVASSPDVDTVAITPNGNYLYAGGYTGGDLRAYSIGTDGKLTPLTVPTYPLDTVINLAISPDSHFLYVCRITEIDIFSIGADGALTPTAPPSVVPPANYVDGLAFSPNQDFAYISCFGGGPTSPVGQFSVNGDGTLSPLSPASVPAGNSSITAVVEPTGRFLYVGNENDATISEFSIGSDGKLTALAPAFVSPSGVISIALARR